MTSEQLTNMFSNIPIYSFITHYIHFIINKEPQYPSPSFSPPLPPALALLCLARHKFPLHIPTNKNYPLSPPYILYIFKYPNPSLLLTSCSLIPDSKILKKTVSK